ncbi:MAG: hypothetical protein M3O36_04960 [Myxococcota bacterium]|nr:hypothetical protein [Myxococcota bacterium]
MTREESRDVYQLFVDRNARLATIVTSNRDTAEWLAAFDDTLLARERGRPVQELRLRLGHRR